MCLHMPSRSKTRKFLVSLNFSSGEHHLEIPQSLKGKDIELLVANIDQPEDKMRAWEARAYLVR
jgi:hypothetical protein